MSNHSQYSPDEDLIEESELWLFTDNSPLPSLEEINTVIQQKHGDFSISTKGAIATLKDNLVQGKITVAASDTEDDEEVIDTAWMAEIVNARSFFSKSPRILKDIGNMTTMLKLTSLDECSLGNILVMAEAFLSMRKGLLAIPDHDESVFVFNNEEALPVLAEEIDLFATEEE